MIAVTDLGELDIHLGLHMFGLLFFWFCNKIIYLLHMHISLYCSMNITANSVYAFYVIYNVIHKFAVSRIYLKK